MKPTTFYFCLAIASFLIGEDSPTPTRSYDFKLTKSSGIRSFEHSEQSPCPGMSKGFWPSQLRRPNEEPPNYDHPDFGQGPENQDPASENLPLNELGIRLITDIKSSESALTLLSALETLYRAQLGAPDSHIAVNNIAVGLEMLGARSQAYSRWRHLLKSMPDAQWRAQIEQNLGLNLAPTEMDSSEAEPTSLSCQLLLDSFEEQFLLQRDLPIDYRPTVALTQALQAYEECRDRLPEDLLKYRHRTSGEPIKFSGDSTPDLRFDERLAVSCDLTESSASTNLKPIGVNHEYLPLYKPECGLALEKAEVLIGSAIRQEHFGTAGRIGQIIGSIQSLRGEPEKALRALQVAERCFRITKQTGRLASTLTQIAVILKAQGDFESEWRHRIESLQLASKFGDNYQLSIIFGLAALSASERGYYYSALALHAETFHLELASRSSLDIAEAFSRRALIRSYGGDSSLSEMDLNLAFWHAQRIVEVSQRQASIDKIRKLGLRLNNQKQPKDSLAFFRGWIKNNHKSGPEFNKTHALYFRSQIDRIHGRYLRADAGLTSALSEFERNLPYLVSQRKRVSRFNTGRPVFEDAQCANSFSGEKLSSHNDVSSRLAQRLQAYLLSAHGAHKSVETRIGEIRTWASLRPRGASPVVIFEVTTEATYVLVCRDDKTFRFDLQLKRTHLKELVDSIRRDLSYPRNRLRSQSLLDGYTALVEPWISSVAEAERLIIIPDEELHRIPFHALTDPASSKFLVEGREIVLSPNLSWADRQSQTFVPSGIRPTLLAVVAETGLQEIDYLPGARKEVETIQPYYPMFSTMKPASSSQFVNLSDRYDFIHFAGHSSSGENRREEPHLIFGPHDYLTASEIQSLDLRRNRLVVLAACETNASRSSYGPDGPATLATAFLRAGARGVLATLSNVGDGESLNFMKRFHFQLSSGIEVPTAFRNAILEMIYSEKKGPTAWGAFVIIGSFSDFKSARDLQSE